MLDIITSKIKSFTVLKAFSSNVLKYNLIKKPLFTKKS